MNLNINLKNLKVINLKYFKLLKVNKKVMKCQTSLNELIKKNESAKGVVLNESMQWNVVQNILLYQKYLHKLPYL